MKKIGKLWESQNTGRSYFETVGKIWWCRTFSPIHWRPSYTLSALLPILHLFFNCNNWCLFLSSQVTPTSAWHCLSIWRLTILLRMTVSQYRTETGWLGLIILWYTIVIVVELTLGAKKAFEKLHSNLLSCKWYSFDLKIFRFFTFSSNLFLIHILFFCEGCVCN